MQVDIVKEVFVNNQTNNKKSNDDNQLTLSDISSQINSSDNKLEEPFLSNNSSANNNKLPIPSTFNDEQYFSFATYQLNNQLNKELVTQDKKIIDEILNDPTKKFVLLINILKLQDKLLIVNNHFMLFQASNQFNANFFNELASQRELLSEIKLAFKDGFY
ncbi:hypothetical protein II941_02770 [bacterium]|nr:hypothetical protein [bacterium]